MITKYAGDLVPGDSLLYWTGEQIMIMMMRRMRRKRMRRRRIMMMITKYAGDLGDVTR